VCVSTLRQREEVCVSDGYVSDVCVRERLGVCVCE